MSDKKKRNVKVSWVVVVAVCTFIGVFLFFSFYQGSTKPPLVAKAEETTGLVKDIKGEGKSVYQTVRENINLLEELKREIERTEDTSQIYDKAVTRIEKVTNSFKRLAGRKEELKKELKQKASRLWEIGSQGKEKIEKLKDKRARYQAKIEQLSGSDTDPEIKRMKEKAYTKTIHFIEMKIQIWEGFLKTHNRIRQVVDNAERVLEKFLTAIQLTALVYQEGLDVVKLNQDLEKARELLNQIPDMKRLTQDMVKSWESLDSLIKELLGQIEGIKKLES